MKTKNKTVTLKRDIDGTGYYYVIEHPEGGVDTQFIVSHAYGKTREWCVWVATFRPTKEFPQGYAPRGKAIFHAKTLNEIREFINMCVESKES